MMVSFCFEDDCVASSRTIICYSNERVTLNHLFDAPTTGATFNENV